METLLAYYPQRGGVSKVVRALVRNHIKRLNAKAADILLSTEDFNA